MSFTSLTFAVFLGILVSLYFAIPHRFRWALLLVANILFYANSGVPALILLLGMTMIDFALARAMARSADEGRRRWCVWISIALSVGVLALFKALDFAFHTPLPLGMSFYIFVKLAYVIDVDRQKYATETHVGIFTAFVTFFPTISSGPIERGDHMLPQFRQPVAFDETRVVEGLRLILWGVFKKVVIADRLALYVNTVYNQPTHYGGGVLLLATLFLAFQIYADFSGYTDIARGIAWLLGFRVMENFRQPYFATSVQDFWRRWHISLSTWIRDYLFLPLSRALLQRGGRRYPRLIEVIVYLIVMGLVGLWHGGAWTFVIWGLLHGVYMSVEAVLNARRIRLLPAWLPRGVAGALHIGFTFALVTISWVFFRANSLADAGYIMTHTLEISASGSLVAPFANSLLSANTEFVLSMGLIALLITVDILDARRGLMKSFSLSPLLVRWVCYYALTAAVLFSGLYAQGAPEFIYFRF
jgi:D-alanyl-lipoteichoic acid acyltransferase DltB (MBOAT superfamily)